MKTRLSVLLQRALPLLIIALISLVFRVRTVAAAENAFLGIPGLATQTSLQITEMRVTYRFDQIGARGKTPDTVPVQIAFKVHNSDKTQTVSVQLPLGYTDGRLAEPTALFVNGKEFPIPKTSVVRLFGSSSDVKTISFPLTVYENADAIVDIRINQPSDDTGFVFRMSTGGAWNGVVQTGSLEALMPYQAQNWNVALRKTGDNELLPLAYSGTAAKWSFSDLHPAQENDAVWLIANPDAMDYFNLGNDAWTQSQGADIHSYETMRNALLDMTPCNGVRMPLESWWNGMYDTMTMGVVAGDGQSQQEQLQRAMQYWSDGWSVPQGSSAACTSLHQRPDRYRTAVKNMLALQPEQRSAASQDALKKHFVFLRQLAAVAADPSVVLANITDDTDPVSANLSFAQRQLLANWDERFAAPEQSKTQGAAAAIVQSSIVKAPFAFVSSTLNRISRALPHLSLRTQIVIFVLLALLVLLLVIVVVVKWKERQDPPASNSDPLPHAFSELSKPSTPFTPPGFESKMNLVHGLGNPPSPSAQTTNYPSTSLTSSGDLSGARAGKQQITDGKQRSAMNDKAHDGAIKPQTTSPAPLTNASHQSTAPVVIQTVKPQAAINTQHDAKPAVVIKTDTSSQEKSRISTDAFKPKTPGPTIPPPTDLPWA